MVVYRVWFNALRDADKVVDAADLSGQDVLELFREFGGADK